MTMIKRLALLVGASLTLTVALALTGTGVQAAPQPVRSEDDLAAPLANRVEAITNVVAVMGRRITRIGELAGSAPGPPNEPLLEAQAHALAVAGLAQELLCPSGPLTATGDDILIADDDRDAEDASAIGLANQAQAVAGVLAQARERLGGLVDILLTAPGPPDEPEAAALTVLYGEAAAIVNQISTMLGLDLRVPPNPC
jgi:hypothetical protein